MPCMGSICGRTLTLGITSFLSQISLVAAMAAINNMLRKYGALDAVFGQEQYAQIPMAVVGIVMKFFQIVISIVVGMAAGCIPIVGYNMGAEQEAARAGAVHQAAGCRGAGGRGRRLFWRKAFPVSSSPFSARPTRAATIPISPSRRSAPISA